MPNDSTSEDVTQMLDFLRAQKQSPPLQSALTNQAPSPLAPVDDSLMGQMIPLTKQALSVVNTIPESITASGNLGWFERNQRKDEQGNAIPIDIDSGINLGEFSRMVWQRRPEDRITVLRKMFPNNIVREADTGEPIVEVAGPGGVKKDVLVNPVGFNAEDFLETIQGAGGPSLAGTAGMLVGQALGSRLGPVGSAVGKVAGAAVGTGLAGATQDVIARKAEGIPLDPAEIAKEQSKQAALNAMFDVGLWAGGKALRVASPFATSKGPLQMDLEQGKKYFKDVHGIDFATTPAEETGAPILARIEATETQLPGSSTVMGKIYKKGQEQIAKIYNAALGGRQSPEDLGKDLISELKTRLVEPAENAVQSARTALRNKGETELADLIDSIAPTTATRKEAGEAARAGFEAKRSAAKTATDTAYAAVRALPGGTGKILSGNPVADAADDILAELPSVLKTKVVPTVDAYGNPISKTVVKKELLKSGIPEGLLGFLSDMQEQRGQKMTIDELTLLKNRARDEIAKTEAVPGVKDRWFGIISKAYDEATDTGLSALPSGNLKTALTTAKDTYKRELLPFDREGLHDVLRTEYEAGFQSPEQLVNRMFSGVRAEHNYRVMKETLGATSPEMDKIRRSLLDSWRMDAVDPLTKRINPNKLEEKMLAMRSAHPELYQDVTKGAEQKLFTVTGALRAAGKEIKDVDPEELSALLRSGNVTARSLQRLFDAQTARDTLLSNTYLKNLATGKTPKESPSQFVASLFNSEIDSSHLNEVLSALPPSKIEDLQTAALYRIATKASESNVDMAKFLHGEQSPVQAFALAKAIGPVGSLERQRNEMLLGPDYLNLVKNTIGVLAPREVKTGLFKAAGGMAATGIIEKLLRVPLQYASQFVRKSVLASLYTSGPIKALLANTVEGPMETAAFANMLIASEPMVRKLVDTFGSDAAYSIVRDAKASIDRSILQDTQPSQDTAQKAELMRFLQGQKSKVKIETNP